MRIERKKVGTRVRVILNRSEIVRAAATFLKDAEADLSKAVAHPKKFESACRIIVRQVSASNAEANRGTVELPSNATFTVGISSEGNVTGVTFQFYEQED